MKKSILTFALLLSVVIVSAKTEITNTINPVETEYSTNVNDFCKLIQVGDYESVKSMIEEGIDVNKKSTGLTPLMFAARHNKVKIVKLLIENGAKLKLRSTKGYTALKYAEISNATEAQKVIKDALVAKKNNKKRKRS